MSIHINVSGRGCSTPSTSSTQFRCSMCRPWKSKLDVRVLDNARSCALSKIADGVIYQYHEPIFEKDPETKKDIIVGYKLIEKFSDK